jgi:hypothetical protein
MRKLSLIYTFIILVLFFFGYINFRQDDAYIFYTYAKNIAEGHGYVFNLGEKVNATTSPLYTLILASVYFLVRFISTDSLPAISNFISVVSILAIVYIIGKMIKDEKMSIIFPLIFLANPLLKYGVGMETFLNLALIVYSVYLIVEKKTSLAAFIMGLSVLARLDSILFVGVLFIYYFLKNKKLPPLKSIFVFMVTLLPWFIFSKIYFNSFLPTTIAVKLSQKDFKLYGTGLVFLKGFFISMPGTILSASILILGFVISAFFLLRNKFVLLKNESLLLIFISFGILFAIYAFILNAPPYQWYYTPFVIPISIIFTYFLSEFFIKNSLKYFILTFLFILAALLPIRTLAQGFNPRYSNYTNAIDWLNKKAKKQSILGVDEIGIMGYYFEKGKIIDALGLVTPDVLPHLKQKDFSWYIIKYKPDYIINDYPEIPLYAGGQDKKLRDNYKMIKIFESRGEKIAILKREEL